MCDEAHLNLAYRWFCRLGLDGKVPDRSTFSLNCNGHFRQSDVLRHVFEAVVRRCITEGLRSRLFNSDARRLKQLEDENRRLKGLVADLTLDKQMLHEVLRKKD